MGSKTTDFVSGRVVAGGAVPATATGDCVPTVDIQHSIAKGAPALLFVNWGQQASAKLGGELRRLPRQAVHLGGQRLQET